MKAMAEPMSAFSLQLNGNFSGVLHWQQLEALWCQVLAKPDGWYVSQIGEVVPQSPLDADALSRFIAEVDALLRHEHQHDYCGIVYADSREQPSFIKIYDPHNLGSFCSHGGATILPRWVLSHVKPERFEEDAPLPGSRQHWWQRIFSSTRT
jgi:hypothetical protein